jgi:subtilisin family serine protease
MKIIGQFCLIKNIIFSLLAVAVILSPLKINAIQSSNQNLNYNKIDSIPDQQLEIQRIKPKDYLNWGIDPLKTVGSINLDVEQVVKNVKPKRSIVVAIIDTGIDYHHHFFKNSLITKEGPATEKNYGLDFTETQTKTKTQKNLSTTPYDSHGHGTHVAGIIKNIFPDVKFLILKYFANNSSQNDTLKASIAAFQYAIDLNVDIINYSGGGPGSSEEEKAVLQGAQKKGILVVTAAGNEHSDIDLPKNAYFPASYHFNNIITVMAHDQSVQLLPSSNWGKYNVDISAPGSKIISTLPYDGSGPLTGTSQATAFVTAVAALLKSHNPKLDASSLKKIIIKSATPIDGLKNKCASSGILNSQGAIENLIKEEKNGQSLTSM